MARGVRFLLGFRQYPFCKKTGPGIPVFGYCPYIYVDLNLLVGVMTFTFSPLHCFYATIVEGGAADWRRRPFLVFITIARF